MQPVIISTEQLSRSPKALAQSAAKAAAQQTLFGDLPLPARVLLAVPRVRGPLPKAGLAERYVLDTLGRIIDMGPERSTTINAVNQLVDVLLSSESLSEEAQAQDQKWLSAIENLALCVLCKVRSGNTQQARQLAQHWLDKSSLEHFNTAAEVLCDSGCFKHCGLHVFTPSWSGPVVVNTTTKHRSVVSTESLSLEESVLLNAVRLRIRTLSFSNINTRVLPLLSQHLALPGMQSLVDAHLIEALQFSPTALAVRCLCCSDISVDEARLVSAMAAFSTSDSNEVARFLTGWLPNESISRLQARMLEFQSVIQKLGTAIPLRDWDMAELEKRGQSYAGCEHSNEAALRR